MNTFNLETFLSPYKQSLEHTGISRLKYYEYVIDKLVSLNKPITILETGTMWAPLEANQGAFTLIFSDLIKNHTGGKLITVDISEEHINNCKSITQKYSDVIEYIVSDSVTYLENLSNEEVNNLDFIYFDSFDLSIPNPVPSQLHHYRELAAVYKRLNPNVILAVDDNYLPGHFVEWISVNDSGEEVHREFFNIGDYRILGKGTLIDYFLLDNGWKRKEDFFYLGGNQLIGYER
jgi:predicted O-methyltransferase YrrM